MIWMRRRSGLVVPDATDRLLLPAPMMGFRGEVTATLRRAKSGSVRKIWRFPNLITDSYLNGMLSATHGVTLTTSFIAAGTSTSAPATSDTTIGGELTGRTNTNTASGWNYVGGSPDAAGYTLAREFGTGQGNGTIGTFGMFSASSGGTMWAACNPLDSGGAPTTIVKTSGDILDVNWQILMQLFVSDIIESHTIAGLARTVTVRNLAAATTSGIFGPSSVASDGLFLNASSTLGIVPTVALVARTSAVPTVASFGTLTSSFSAYTPGSFVRDLFASFGAATQFYALGTSGAGTGSADSHGSFQLGLSSSIPASTTLQIRYTVGRV